MPDLMPQPEDVAEEIKRAIEALEFEVEEWERLVREARIRVDARRDDVEGLLTLYSSSLIAHEKPVDRPLLRDIYWHHPAVRVKSLAAPLGVKNAGVVYQIVGPLPTGRVCQDCGAPLGQASRQSGKSYFGAATRCPDCAEVRHAAYVEHWQREMVARRERAREEETRVNESLRDGVEPSRILVGIEGETGLWRVLSDGSARRATDEDLFGSRD